MMLLPPLCALFDTMASGMRTLASFRAENVRLRAENERLKRWQRRAEILESENRQLKTTLGAAATTDLSPITARAISAPVAVLPIHY